VLGRVLLLDGARVECEPGIAVRRDITPALPG
jgi:hypothetical protein